MGPVTTAIIAALTVGATGGLTDTAKTAMSDAYQGVKALLAKKFGAKSAVVEAVTHLEAKPDSSARQQGVQEEVVATHAEQDNEVLALARHLLSLLPQAAPGAQIIQHVDHGAVSYSGTATTYNIEGDQHNTHG